MSIYPVQLSAATKLISAIVLAGATAFLTVAAFVWLLFYMKNMENSFTVIESKIFTLEDSRAAAKRVTGTIQEEELALRRISKFFIDQKNPVSFIEELETLAQDTRNKISLNIDEQKSTSDSLVFHLTLDGDTTSVMRYVKLLELLPHEIIISDIGYQENEPAPASLSIKNAPPAEHLRNARLIIEIHVTGATI